MNSTQNPASWLSQIDANQQVFAGGLDKTLSYLRNARTPNQGWGPYPKLGSDLHHSALAIQALSYSQDKSSIGTIAGAASVVRKENEERLEQLSTEEISDLVAILRAEQKPGDDQFLERLIALLEGKFDGFVAQGSGVTVRSLCSAVLAVLETRQTDVETVRGWLDQLLTLQRPDGGWPTVSGQTSMVIPTALVLRVLAKLGKGSTTEAMRRGLYFLQDQLSKTGWMQLGSGGDTFTQSVVLRALAEVPEADYKWIQEGVDILINKMNADGSWGERSGEQGNVESTALTLLALVAAGENRFVPTRLVRTALIDVQRQLDEITEERNKLREDFDNRVQEVCGEVAQERNTLKRESQELKDRVRSAQEEGQKAIELRESAELRQQVLERELQLLRLQQESRSSPPIPDPSQFEKLQRQRRIAGVEAIIVTSFPPILGAAVIWRWEWPPSIWRVIGLVAVLLGASALSWFLLQQIRSRRRLMRVSRSSLEDYSSVRYRQDFSEPSSNLESLRYIYMDMASEWPASVREEVAYRLLTEMLNMPPDIAPRYAEELTFRLDIPSYQRSQLSDWVRQASRLTGAERRLLFDQLRRSTLR